MVKPEFPRTIYDSMKPPPPPPIRVNVSFDPANPGEVAAQVAAARKAVVQAAERAARAHVEQAWLEAEKSALELLRFELGAAGCALRRAGLHLVAAFGAAMVRARGRR